MKKLIIGIGSILITAFVVLLFVNANNSPDEPKKTKTEVNKGESTVPCSAACSHSAANKTATCDPSKCKEMNCSHKDGKCDPATCTAHKGCGQKESMACEKKTTCPETCKAKSTAVK